jgi:DNA-binding CsgD family transcriptional regulator
MAFLLSMQIRNKEEIDRPNYPITMPKRSLFLICFAFFLLNIGGGVFFELIEPMILNEAKISVYYYILPYIYASAGVLLLLLLKKTKEMIDIFLTFAAGLITIGLIVFQFSHTGANLVMVDLLIQSGYAILDIFMWGIIGMMAYVYNQSYKIASFSMSSNITAVILGIIGSKILAAFIEEPKTIVPLIAIVSLVIAIILIPFLYRITINDLRKGATVLENEQDKLIKIQQIKNYKQLTNREKEVVQYMLLELTNHNIAKKLFISENTLKTHAKNIYTKLEVKNKRELKELLR